MKIVLRKYAAKINLVLLCSILCSIAIGQTQTFTSSGTFTVPAGVTNITVQCWGAGGGGSSISNNNRRGGGGGGGAFASSVVTVTPGTTYTVTVGNGGAANSAGGNSSFNNTTVVAAGGGGGTNNSSTAGSGGTVGASTGTIENAGGNGAAGGGTNSGGGGGGAGSGGAGSNASGGTGGTGGAGDGGAGANGVNGSSNGIAGNLYGGGGSGAVTNSAPNRTGGAGANGRVVISWTCPTYSISSTSGTTPVCPGASSTITLTALTANLPVGSYTVTYNVSAPNAASGLTASMPVTSAGTGSFSTDALANVGATTITITNLASGGGTGTGTLNCNNSIASNNTAVINVSGTKPAITTQPSSQALCIGSALNLSVAATGATSYQWKKNDVNIGGATAASYSVSAYALANAGSYSVDVINDCGSTSSNIVYVSTKAAQPAVTASVSTTPICAGASIDLTASSAAAVSVFSENFNGASNNWTTSNTGTGGTVADANWTLRANNYSYSGTAFNSNDASQFYLSNSDDQGNGSTTATALQSYPFSTQGLSAASLTFYHFYRYYDGAESGTVEISTNGTTWNTLATYTSTQGARNNFSLVTINLASYLNQSTVILRFRYDATYDYYWAIDNVNVTGTLTTPFTYGWSSAPAGFTSSLQNPTGVSPTVNTNYMVLVTNGAGCSNSNSAAVVVNALPTINTQPTAPAATCTGTGTQTLTVGASGTGITYSWRRGGVAVSNGGAVSGQGTATLTLTNPTAANAGSYDVVVSGTCSPSATSNAVTVTVNGNTAITIPASPVTQTVLLNNAPANLTLSATGTALTYQWYSNLVNSNSGGTSVGAANGGQTNTYTPPTNTAGTRYYYCIVSGSCGGNVASSAIEVLVTNTNQWAGGGSTNWNLGSNWTLGVPPTGVNDAIIPAGTTPYPVLTATTTINNLSLGTGTSLGIGTNILTINGAVSGAGQLVGSNTSEVVIGGTAGTLNFNQTGSGNVLKSLTLNNAATATLGNLLNITAYDGIGSEGVLTVTGTGVLTTGGFLVIQSNINGTARIAPGNTAGGYIVGDVSVERYIPQNDVKSWRLLASNTSGQTINQAWQEGVVGGLNDPNPGFGTMITGSGASLGTVQSLGFDTLSLSRSLFKYNATTDALVYVPNTISTQLSSEQGYFLFIRGDRRQGTFNTGSATAPVSGTVLRSKGSLFLGDQSSVSTGASNYGLVRNPYPSRIDMRSIVTGGSLIDAYQVWDSKLGGSFGVGGFQTFTRTGANYTIAPGGGSYGSNGSIHNFIESGAAFYIQSSGGPGTAQVTEACKAAASSHDSYRPTDGQQVERRIAFTLQALNPGSTDVVDGGLVYLNDGYSNDVTIEDVRKSGNFNENFGILRNNTDLVVERRKDVTTSDSIFFKMYQMRRISYRLDIAGLNFGASTTAILEDKFTNTNTPIDLSATTSYTFTVSAVAGSSASDRFRIVLASSNIFTGSGNWTDNARWSRGVPPVANENVVIASGAQATLDTDYTVEGNLSMASNSMLVVNPTKTITVSGAADFASQSVTFKSDATGYGSLGQVTGTLSGATNVTVERYIPNNGFRSWRLLAVPTYGNGQTIREAWQEGASNPLPLQNNLANRGTLISGAFGSNSAAAAAGFDGATTLAGLLKWNGSGWSNVTSTNTAIADEKSYFLFIRGDRSKPITGPVSNAGATTLRTNGTVYTGSQQFNVPTSGLGLIANTYPSAINFLSLAKSNINNVFYVWDSKKQNGNSLGMYQTFSATNGYNCIISGGSYAFGQPNTIIESGQSFFVRGGSTAGGGTITLLESAKVSGSGNLGFRPSAFAAKINSRLLDIDNTVLDANVVVFDNAYSKSVDTDDAEKIGNPGANLAVETNGKILAIEGTQLVGENDIVQFRMWNLKQQDYKLEFAAANLNIQNLFAVLEDSYTGLSKELNTSGGNTVINFTVDNNAASGNANRFRIVFSKQKPAISLETKPGFTIAPNPVEGRTVNMLFNKQAAGKYSVRIISADGKSVTNKMIEHAGGNSNQLILLPAGIVPGNYQVEVLSPTNVKSIQQIFVKGTL